jgi:hypothetical protein
MDLPEKPTKITLIVPPSGDVSKAIADVAMAFGGAEITYRSGETWGVEFDDTFENCPWWHVKPVAKKILRTVGALAN